MISQQFSKVAMTVKKEEEKEIFERDARNGEDKQSVLSQVEKPPVGLMTMKHGLFYL